jgi:protein-S-isoprenylcysteine O-methyltransferase Ste14
MAWLYLGVFAATQGLMGLVIIPNNPDLVMERTQMDRSSARPWDRLLSGVVTLFGPTSTWIVTGLDLRFSWSDAFSPGLQAAAACVAILGSLLTAWAMASNRFFYGFVRICKERGHSVATQGPYRVVRHPGYAGGILFNLATPAFLGSSWAYLPACLTAAVLVIRTALEDRTLQAELDGYITYAGRVRYRLLPGLW